MPQKPARKWFEYRHLVTFGDTNVVGNVYFANYSGLHLRASIWTTNAVETPRRGVSTSEG